jgi:hypothetical protein
MKMDRAISIRVNPRKRCTAEVTRWTQNHNRGCASSSAGFPLACRSFREGGNRHVHSAAAKFATANPSCGGPSFLVTLRQFNVLTNYTRSKQPLKKCNGSAAVRLSL